MANNAMDVRKEKLLKGIDVINFVRTPEGRTLLGYYNGQNQERYNPSKLAEKFSPVVEFDNNFREKVYTDPGMEIYNYVKMVHAHFDSKAEQAAQKLGIPAVVGQLQAEANKPADQRDAAKIDSLRSKLESLQSQLGDDARKRDAIADLMKTFRAPGKRASTAAIDTDQEVQTAFDTLELNI